MTDQLDLFAAEQTPDIYPCWRCGKPVNFDTERFPWKGSSNWGAGEPPFRLHTTRSGKTKKIHLAGVECFDCNHAVAIKQLAAAAGWTVEQINSYIANREGTLT